jgi:hypothetical protein
MSDDNTKPIVDTNTQSPTEVKLRLNKPHLLIQRTLDIKVEKDPYGYDRQPRWPGVDIRVSKSSKRNALIILDRLFKTLEKRDVEISVMDGGYNANGTYAIRDRDDKVQLYVEEEHRKVPHVPTPKELREKEGPFAPRIPKNDSVPTGKLTLVPGGVVDLSTEETLALLIAKAVDEIVHILDEQQARRKAAAAQQRREYERQKQEQEEKVRVESLHKAATAFRRYREMMDYIEEVRRFGRVPDDQGKEGQTLEEWLQWAEWQARIVHPIG